jgi:2-iminobutanoate/2-iminopropanoate deaminase
MKRRIIVTSNAPSAIGPYSQAVQAGNTVYLSGQIPLDASTGRIIGEDITEQTHQVMKNIGEILKAAGYKFKDVVKVTCLLADINDFQKMNDVYAEYFSENSPARSTYEVSNLPRGVKIEIETTAVR